MKMKRSMIVFALVGLGFVFSWKGAYADEIAPTAVEGKSRSGRKSVFGDEEGMSGKKI